MTREEVCIIIAAYNAQNTIVRAIASALAEPEVTQVVVVDDASTDATVAVAKSCDDGSGRLKVLVQPRSGPSAARNRAIAETDAPWIGILDADDFFLTGRTSGLLAYAGEADFIADDLWQVGENAVGGARKSLLEGTLTLPCSIDFSEFVVSNVTGRGANRKELGFIKPLMRRNFLEQHALRYKEELWLGEDFELYARSLALGARLILVPAQGYVSVVRQDSLSGRHSEADLKKLRDCGQALQTELKLTREESHALRLHYLSVDCRLQWRLLINAVKQRDVKATLATFLRPYPVPVYLLEQLLQQCYIRTIGKLFT